MSDLELAELKRHAQELQKLRSLAAEQLMDAELGYEDVTRQCREAWDKYHLEFEKANGRFAIRPPPPKPSIKTCELCGKPIIGNWNICRSCFHDIEIKNSW